MELISVNKSIYSTIILYENDVFNFFPTTSGYLFGTILERKISLDTTIV